MRENVTVEQLARVLYASSTKKANLQRPGSAVSWEKASEYFRRELLERARDVLAFLNGEGVSDGRA